MPREALHAYKPNAIVGAVSKAGPPTSGCAKSSAASGPSFVSLAKWRVKNSWLAIHLILIDCKPDLPWCRYALG
jgi:hypothetical protein